jgi:hypothetical protein
MIPSFVPSAVLEVDVGDLHHVDAEEQQREPPRVDVHAKSCFVESVQRLLKKKSSGPACRDGMQIHAVVLACDKQQKNFRRKCITSTSRHRPSNPPRPPTQPPQHTTCSLRSHARTTRYHNNNIATTSCNLPAVAPHPPERKTWTR